MRKLLVLMLCCFTLVTQGQTVISGKLTDRDSGEDMAFATVMIKGTYTGTTTNAYGFYSLTLEPEMFQGDSVVLFFSYVGYKPLEHVYHKGDKARLNINMQIQSSQLKTVEITAQAKEEVDLRSAAMSITRVPIRNTKNLPTIAGEADVIKAIQLLPGISGGSEGGTALFVRGGDADQNLVLLDEATVYNVGHLFGFFSVFNSDAISDMSVTKGAFPASQGGRLSSILDIRMKEGHAKEFHGEGGIGLLSSRLTLQGPIMKDRMSFLVSGRRTYIDQVFKVVGTQVPYYFYDLNAKLNFKISEKDRLFYSMYFGNDVLSFNGDDYVDDTTSTGENQSLSDLGFGFTLGNNTHTLRWNHIYNPKLFSNVSIVTTNFKYNITGKVGDNNIFVSSSIFDVGIKADFDHFYSNTLMLKYGASMVNHTFKPNIVSTSGDIASLIQSSVGPEMQTQEFALYGLLEKDLDDHFKLNAGLRLSGAVVKEKVYSALEPRLSMRYLFSNRDAIKFSYSKMTQYMHRVSSSTVSLPTDLWYPITRNIKPQIADQVAIGYNHLFKKIQTSLVIEGYYKKMSNLIEYREGANLVLNNDFESSLLQGTGEAYGTEFLLKKDDGRLNGWMSYTLSWAFRDFDELNNGKRFHAKYDRRHSFSIVGNYQISDRWLFSVVWVYQSGARFTAQIGQYLMPNATLTEVEVIPIYTERNAVEMSPSHRLDVNLTLKSKSGKRFSGEWSFGCYNLYNRTQPYRINIVAADDGAYKYQQQGLFGFIPSIAYNFKF